MWLEHPTGYKKKLDHDEHLKVEKNPELVQVQDIELRLPDLGYNVNREILIHFKEREDVKSNHLKII